MAIYGQFSCDMPTELLKKGVGWQDRAVYAEAALYCRKELTDGVIDRVLLSMWMIDMPVPARTAALDRMVKLRALRKHKRGWTFPPHVWSQWGVMKADVDAKRAAEAQRKADYRAKMSQRDKGGTVADVPASATRPSEPVPDSKRQRQSQRKSHKTEPPGTSLSVTHDDSADEGRTDGPIGEVIELLAARLASEHPSRIPGAADSHRAVIANDVATKHGATIAARVAQLPNSTPDVIAASLQREIQ